MVTWNQWKHTIYTACQYNFTYFNTFISIIREHPLFLKKRFLTLPRSHGKSPAAWAQRLEPQQSLQHTQAINKPPILAKIRIERLKGPQHPCPNKKPNRKPVSFWRQRLVSQKTLVPYMQPKMLEKCLPTSEITQADHRTLHPVEEPLEILPMTGVRDQSTNWLWQPICCCLACKKHSLPIRWPPAHLSTPVPHGLLRSEAIPTMTTTIPQSAQSTTS